MVTPSLPAGTGLTRAQRPDTTQSYQADLAAIQQFAPAYKEQVYAVTVGSETLYRKNFTGPQLVTIMQQTKTALNGMFKIGTADSWNKYADGTADAVIQSKPDILCAPPKPSVVSANGLRLVNAFGFWQGSPINNATHTYFDDIMQAFTHIESVSGGAAIEVWTGETGWPTSESLILNLSAVTDEEQPARSRTRPPRAACRTRRRSGARASAACSPGGSTSSSSRPLTSRASRPASGPTASPPTRRTGAP